MKYKTHDGKELDIKNMNSYHLISAIKCIIRRIIIKFYDNRFKIGYVRTPTRNQMHIYVNKKLAKNKIYKALVREATKRCEPFDELRFDYVTYIDDLCRKEWSLYFRLQKVSAILRK